MHYSAKRGIEIACRLSVCLSVCDVGGSESHKLEILETNCTDIISPTSSLFVVNRWVQTPGLDEADYDAVNSRRRLRQKH